MQSLFLSLVWAFLLLQLVLALKLVLLFYIIYQLISLNLVTTPAKRYLLERLIYTGHVIM